MVNYFSYKDQLDMLSNLRLKDGESTRTDCPFCGGRNTFGAHKINGVLEWNCFRASCGVKGRKDDGRSVSNIVKLLAGEEDEHSSGIAIPTSLFSVRNHSQALEYLVETHCLEAYENNLVDVKYYPQEDRVMFGVTDSKTSNIVGYSGRALDGSFPKWRKFGDTTHLFTCGNGPIGVLVEDAPSATAVGTIPDFTGLSILGTALTLTKKLELKRYSKLLVALDKDASLKAINFVRRIGSTASIVFIPNDLKYFSKERIWEILSNGDFETDF